MSKHLRTKHWVFTLNNPPNIPPTPLGGAQSNQNDNDEPLTDDTFAGNAGLIQISDYLIYQYERGETGTLHIQGYIVFKERRTLKHCKTILDKAHWEPKKGTVKEAIAYNSKQETRVRGPYEFGTKPLEQGGRYDLLHIKEMLDSGKKMEDVADLYYGDYIRYRNGFSAYLQLKKGRARTWKTNVIVIIGEPGTGKSRFCIENYPDAYWKDSSDEFWDGYDGHDTIILDDFYGWISYTTMLRIMDRYPLLLNVKGSKVPLMAKTLIITSNTEPERWYKNIFNERKSALQAFERRIDEIKRF